MNETTIKKPDPQFAQDILTKVSKNSPSSTGGR